MTIAYKRLDFAKKKLDSTKRNTFGIHEKNFEQTLRVWRGKARDRIVSLVPPV